MKRNFLILFAVCLSALLMTDTVSAQSYNRASEKRITHVKVKTPVLGDALCDGDEFVYRFKACAGQRITIKLIGRDTDFSLYLNFGLDAELFAEDAKHRSGKMPSEFNGNYEIAVRSNYKVAD